EGMLAVFERSQFRRGQRALRLIEVSAAQVPYKTGFSLTQHILHCQIAEQRRRCGAVVAGNPSTVAACFRHASRANAQPSPAAKYRWPLVLPIPAAFAAP